MSGIEDFRASREARREATRPGRHYDPAAYLAEQRIRENMMLESLARERARRKAAAQRSAQQQQPTGRVAATTDTAATANPEPEPTHSASGAARTHVSPDTRPAKRHWYSPRRWGHA
ncbi:hypothetical protein [Actinoalloteichus hymeniacidonis]|uniref:Uncharacterized protein n=1 Tax=Actinoalloteichus hymeniacidonis TaxID=340345 RepID=A0AAC9HP75_9PSEU|nr:hypothetical protein [Actinoalloteichus hymeniacidonis]AOS62831.1 hypothetical protein TL08_10080 [Actinoalloteichus hymeniacidonis]MBB5909137.1 hypothetical protein [Actinoalloteichus hymeniacidonis]